VSGPLTTNVERFEISKVDRDRTTTKVMKFAAVYAAGRLPFRARVNASKRGDALLRVHKE
jgi:hypothetical protein